MRGWRAWTALAAANLAASCSTVEPARVTPPAKPAPAATERTETLRREAKDRAAADPVEVTLAGFDGRPSSPKVSPLDAIDLSHPITREESKTIAAAYLSSFVGCGSFHSVEERPNSWRWTVLVCTTSLELAEKHIVLNKRTGGVSGLGPRYRSLAALKHALADRLWP